MEMFLMWVLVGVGIACLLAIFLGIFFWRVRSGRGEKKKPTTQIPTGAPDRPHEPWDPMGVQVPPTPVNAQMIPPLRLDLLPLPDDYYSAKPRGTEPYTGSTTSSEASLEGPSPISQASPTAAQPHQQFQPIQTGGVLLMPKGNMADMGGHMSFPNGAPSPAVPY